MGRLALLLLVCMLPACTTPPTSPQQNSTRPPERLAYWTASGKASLSGPEGTETVNLTWERQTLEHEFVQLAGPLGLGALELARHGDVVTWQSEDQPQPLSTLPLTSTARQVVAQLPLEELGSWILGYPPETGSWKIQITQWQAFEQWRVPRKITLSHSRFEIRMVLLDWRRGAQ